MVNNAQTTANNGVNKANAAQNTANNAIPKNKITRSQTVTTDDYVMSAYENNPNMNGTIRNQLALLLSNHGDFIHKDKKSFTAKPSDWLGSGFTINIVDDIKGSDRTYSPVNLSNDHQWFNVITFGVTTRCTQIACYAYINQTPNNGNKVWIRTEHDGTATDWQTIR